MKALLFSLVILLTSQVHASIIQIEKLSLTQKENLLHSLAQLDTQTVSQLLSEPAFEWFLIETGREFEGYTLEASSSLSPVHGRLELEDDAFKDPFAPTFD